LGRLPLQERKIVSFSLVLNFYKVINTLIISKRVKNYTIFLAI